MTPEVARLGANLRFLARELARRGIAVEVLDVTTGALRARLGDHVEWLVDVESTRGPFATSVFAGHKALTKQILADGGVSVPRGRSFVAEERDLALAFALELGPPVVVKPCLGSHGHHVFLELDSADEIARALDVVLAEPDGGALVEEQFDGEEHRVFVTTRGDVAIVRRDPAHVIGDGASTIRQLAYEESHRRIHPRRSSAGPIRFDAEAVRHLARRGRAPEDVPAAGEKVYVRRNSNLMSGGLAEDRTEAAHESVFALAGTILGLFPGLPLVGFDLLTRDLAAPQTPERYRVLELNPVPGLGMHMAPAQGPARDAAGAVADLLFPETAASPPRAAPGPLPAREAGPLALGGGPR